MTMFWKEKAREKTPEIVLGVIFIALIWSFGYLISHQHNATEKRYGFCAMTPDMQLTPCHIEPIMIRCVKQGGAFDKAGFKDKDILVSPEFNSTIAFFKSLKKAKGTSIEFEVITYEDFNPVCDPDKRGKHVKRVVIAP